MKIRPSALVLSVLVASACGGSDASQDDAMGGDMPMEAPMRMVSITQPADGSTVTGPVVTVRLTTDVPIAQAGDMTPGTGHHHLFLDGDLSPAEQPIPTVPGAVIHMGDGSSSFTFDAVTPGEHRLIAVVADGAHVPLVPHVVDTVHFTVVAP